MACLLGLKWPMCFVCVPTQAKLDRQHRNIDYGWVYTGTHTEKVGVGGEEAKSFTAPIGALSAFKFPTLGLLMPLLFAPSTLFWPFYHPCSQMLLPFVAICLWERFLSNDLGVSRAGFASKGLKYAKRAKIHFFDTRPDWSCSARCPQCVPVTRCDVGAIPLCDWPGCCALVGREH